MVLKFPQNYFLIKGVENVFTYLGQFLAAPNCLVEMQEMKMKGQRDKCERDIQTNRLGQSTF
jgi:hypothetical protein